MQAPAADRRHAEAARAAALAEGLVNDAPGERRVTVVFSGPGVVQAGELAPPAAGSWMRGALIVCPALPQASGRAASSSLQVFRPPIPAR